MATLAPYVSKVKKLTDEQKTDIEYWLVNSSYTVNGDDWKNTFKNYIENLAKFDSLQYAYDAVQRINRETVVNITNEEKKQIQFDNRTHGLKIAAYQKRTGNNIVTEKVGAVLIKPNSEAIFVRVQNYNEAGQQTGQTLSYPKGQYEYILTGAGVDTAEPEGLLHGALRELREETGFVLNGAFNEAAKTITGSFQRTVAGNVETIPIQYVDVSGNTTKKNVYVLIYVDDVAISNTPPANTENIIRVEWNAQYSGGGAQQYNQFSQQNFPYKAAASTTTAASTTAATTTTSSSTTNPGGGGKKRKSKKTRSKKHYRHKKTHKRRRYH